MAIIPGSVRLGGFIAPTDTEDIYATQDEFWNRGGYRTVQTINGRDAITADRRKIGMLVNVLDDNGEQKFYTLINGLENTDWEIANLGNGGTAPGGTGDMEKSVYDTNDNGIVDLAENANKVNNLTVETAVPQNAVFTDTTYSIKDGELSEKNFTSAYKTKLDLINELAEENVQPDWNETDTNSDAYILNKPEIAESLWETDGNILSSKNGESIIALADTQFTINFNTADANGINGFARFYKNAVFLGYAGPVNISTYTSSGQNFAYGVNALQNITTARGSVAFGRGALQNISTSNQNTAIGTFAGQNLVNGDNNILIGNASGKTATDLSDCVAIGTSAGYLSGANNLAIGSFALCTNDENAAGGDHNVAIGSQSLIRLSDGDYNLGLGSNAGRYDKNGAEITTYNHCTYLGFSTKSKANGQSNEIVIGANAAGNGSNTATIGASTNLANYFVGSVFIKEQTAAYTNLNDYGQLYTKTDGKLYYVSDDGTEYDLTEVGESGISSPLTTKGDIFVYSSGDARLPVGTDGYVLTADSSEVSGLKWVEASSGGSSLWETDGSVLNFAGNESILNIPENGSITQNNLNLIKSKNDSIFSGVNSGRVLTTGGNNVGIGPQTFYSMTEGDYNVALGASAQYSLTTGIHNLGFGYHSLLNNITGGNNISIGNRTLSTLTDGSFNIAMGYWAGYLDKDSNSVSNATYGIFIGNNSKPLTNNGTSEVIIGANTTYGQGSHTTTIGDINNTSLFSNGNLFIKEAVSISAVSGYGQMIAKTDGKLYFQNDSGTEFDLTAAANSGSKWTKNGNILSPANSETFIQMPIYGGIKSNGTDLIKSGPTYSIYLNGAGNNSNTGAHNIFNGKGAGVSITSGERNIFLGSNSGNKTTTASNNVFVGTTSGYNNITGYHNIFMGYYSGLNNTSGFYNVFIGRDAGSSNTTGSYNIAIGLYSGKGTSDKDKNTFIGYQSGQNSNATANTFYGYRSGTLTTSGSNNVAVGSSSLYSNTTGANNTVLGPVSLYNLTEGNNNISIGSSSGRYYNTGGDFLTKANNSIFLGYNVRAGADNGTNEIVIGANAVGKGSNTVTIGHTDITSLFSNGTIQIRENTPQTTLAGYGQLYVKTDGCLYFKNDAGVETKLT